MVQKSGPGPGRPLVARLWCLAVLAWHVEAGQGRPGLVGDSVLPDLPGRAAQSCDAGDARDSASGCGWFGHRAWIAGPYPHGPTLHKYSQEGGQPASQEPRRSDYQGSSMGHISARSEGPVCLSAPAVHGRLLALPSGATGHQGSESSGFAAASAVHLHWDALMQPTPEMDGEDRRVQALLQQATHAGARHMSMADKATVQQWLDRHGGLASSTRVEEPDP